MGNRPAVFHIDLWLPHERDRSSALSAARFQTMVQPDSGQDRKFTLGDTGTLDAQDHHPDVSSMTALKL
jgi:hypothetical protein